MRLSFLYKILIPVFLLSPLFILAQEPKLEFRHITTEQGLSGNTITCIFQDSRGFMWFGTTDGLNRYDGTGMIIFRNNPSDDSTISDNQVNCIYEDRFHTLWVGTQNGLNAYDISTNRFTRYLHDPQKTGSISHNKITSLAEDKNGDLWVSTYGGGLDRFDPKQKFFLHLRRAGSNYGLSDDRINCLYRDARSQLWIGTEKGLDLFDPETRRFTFYAPPTNTGIKEISSDTAGNLWLGTEQNGLLKFQPLQNQFEAYKNQPTEKASLGSNQVLSILNDRKGRVWVGSQNGGLTLLVDSSKRIYNYQDEPGNPSSLSQRTVSALLEDNQGNLWVGTQRGGINVYSPNTSGFRLFRSQPGKNSLSHNDVRAFCESGDTSIWIGTFGGGLDLYNRRDQTFTNYQYNLYDRRTISSNNITHITRDSEGNTWFSTWGGGVSLLRRYSTRFQRFRHKKDDSLTLGSNYVSMVLEDRNRNIWVGTYYDGLNLFHRYTETFSRLDTAADGNSWLQGKNIIALAEDKKGNIWIGTQDGGLNRYNPGKKSFDHYFNDGEKLPGSWVFFTDSKGRFWVGLDGLYLFDDAKNRFLLATSEASLRNVVIKGITEDSLGYLWISASEGITRYHPEKKLIKAYTVRDGLQGSEFEANSCLKTMDGEIYFGGVNGFNCFYPAQIQGNRFVPPVWITGFQIFNKEIYPSPYGPLKTAISLAKEIYLDWRQSSISFSFASLNYTAPENNQYAYKLEGLQDQWVYAGSDHKVSFTNLSPGTYTFHVKASNNDGVWNEKGAAVKIIIKPPFWQSWWFRGLILLAFFAAVTAYYQYRKKEVIRKMKEKNRQEIHEMQLQFFNNISHEIRTPLSMILAPLEKLEKENNQPVFAPYYNQMHRNVNRMLVSMNELVDFWKTESGGMKLKVLPGNLVLFLQELEAEFHELAEEKKIRFSTLMASKIEDACFDRQVLEKIITNLLSNAFKYTAEGGQVELEILSSNEYFSPAFDNRLTVRNRYKPKRVMYIRVADNGKGISKESLPFLFDRYYRVNESHVGSGLSLAMAKNLVVLHKGSMAVYSEKNRGMEIVITIPIDKDDYTREEKWIRHEEAEIVSLETNPYKYDLKAVLNSSEAKMPGELAKHSILVVAGDATVKHFLSGELASFYKIIEANNGKEGLEKAKENYPDLVICDKGLPVMDAIEFCKQLKTDVIISHIPFLMLGNQDSNEALMPENGIGADYHLGTADQDNLLPFVKNIFDQQKQLKQQYLTDPQADAMNLVHSARDKEFMEELLSLIEMQLSNPGLDVEFICVNTGMSRTRLYQKIKAISGQSIGDFVLTIRLRKARELMTGNDLSIADVIFRVGIQTQAYFSKAFKKEFGITPIQYLLDLKKKT